MLDDSRDGRGVEVSLTDGVTTLKLASSAVVDHRSTSFRDSTEDEEEEEEEEEDSIAWNTNPPRIVYPTSRIVSPMVEKRNATKLLRQPRQRRARLSRCSPSCFVRVSSFRGVPTTARRRIPHRRPFVAPAAAASTSTAKSFPDLTNLRVFRRPPPVLVKWWTPSRGRRTSPLLSNVE